MSNLIKFPTNKVKPKVETLTDIENEFDAWLAKDSKLQVISFALHLVGLASIITLISIILIISL